MRFLDWLRNESNEEPNSQLSLLGNSQPLPEKHREDRADVVKKFHAQLKDSGGGPRIYRDAVEAETQELFGGSTQQLYRGVGGKEGDRDTLPPCAQHAYMHNELECTQRLKHQGPQQGNQRQRNHKIVNEVRKTSRKNKSLWDWNQ